VANLAGVRSNITRYKGFDAYTESIENADIRFTLTRLKTPLWIKTSVSLPGDIHIQVAAEGSGDIAQGCTPGDGYHLLSAPGVMPRTGRGVPKTRWCVACSSSGRTPSACCFATRSGNTCGTLGHEETLYRDGGAAKGEVADCCTG
jgi:hypothetical protein